MSPIREFANQTFAQILPQLAELGQTEFRRAVMNEIMRVHGCTLAAAATHYNAALIHARIHEPKAVEGIGRPEEKKGGRPVIYPVTVVKVKDGSTVAQGISRHAATVMIETNAVRKFKPKLTILERPKAAPVAAKPVDTEMAPLQA